MSKKTIIAATLVFLILVSAMLVFVEIAKANPMMIVSDVPRIKLLSPQLALYRESNVNLSFYGGPVSWGNVEYSSIKYWLDGELKGTLDTTLKASEVYSANLTGLTDGQHTMEVKAIVTVESLTTSYAVQVLWGNSAQTSSGIINFTTDATAPTVFIVSTQHTFAVVDVPFNFTLSKSASELTYSLDGSKNVTINDNVTVAQIYGQDNYYFTLNGLAEGSHSLKIYAKDIAGFLGESQTFFFTVNTQPTPSLSPIPATSPSPTSTQTPSPSPTQQPTPSTVGYVVGWWIPYELTAGLIVLCVSLGILIYFKKRKK